MADHSRMKLGKKPRRYDRRTLRLARYLTPALPPPPPAVTNSENVTSWGMMLNGPNNYGQGIPSEGLGDCTIAGVAHAIQVWTLAQGKESRFPIPRSSITTSNGMATIPGILPVTMEEKS